MSIFNSINLPPTGEELLEALEFKARNPPRSSRICGRLKEALFSTYLKITGRLPVVLLTFAFSLKNLLLIRRKAQ